MGNTIDTLQIEIESSTTDAQRGLTKLKNSLQKLTEMSNAVANMNSDGISKLKEMAQGVESLANAGSNPGLSAAVSELRKLSKIDFSNLGTGSEKISEIADKVGEITNANPTSTITPPETSTETVPIAPSVDVEETKGKLSQLKEFAANIFSSIKTGATTVFGGVAKVIGGAFKGIVTVFQKLGSAAKSVFGAMKKLGSYIGGKLKGAVGGATKKFSGFIRSMGRVAMYRAIRFVLSQIATAFKEGTNNVYQYSKAIGGNLASSMDRIASSFLYFKNSIGAMVVPLINALAPAIEYVIDKAVALINVLNQLFAKLSGASTWTKAVKTQTEYAEAAGGAAEAAKSLTAGFDELNVLSDSGGGGGAGGMDYGSMFEEMQLDSDFAKWIDQIKEAIANGDWAGVGKILGDKVNELIDKVDFAGIGDKLGYGIQSAFEVLYNFLDTINFDKIGAGIATTLNHMMEQIDFGLVGKTFAKKWTILVDTLYGFVTTFDWTKFGLAIADFINGWFEEIDLTKAVQTAQELKTYELSEYHTFKVYEPKERDVMSNSFRDKVVQHSLCDNVLEILRKKNFLYDNYASQVGKGTDFGLNRLDGFMHKFYRQHGLEGWVLKCDIRKYFYSIPHEYLKRILEPYVPEEDVRWLLWYIIDSTADPGIPIGNQSSQLLAVLCLSPLDHFIKEKLGIKYYGRYMDDFYLIHEDKEYLKQCLKDIGMFLAPMGMQLNQKTQIFPLKNGVDFLGFHIYLTETGKTVWKIRRRSKSNMSRKLKKFRKLLDRGLITMESIHQSYQSWKGHALRGNCHHLVREMDELYNSLFKEDNKDVSITVESADRGESQVR